MTIPQGVGALVFKGGYGAYIQSIKDGPKGMGVTSDQLFVILVEIFVVPLNK